MTALEKILKFGKGSAKIKDWESQRLIYLPYRLVRKDLPDLLTADDLEEAVRKVAEVQGVSLPALSGNQVMEFILFLRDELEFIAKIEEINLSSEPKPEMLAAGVAQLNDHSYLVGMKTLSKEWNIPIKEIEGYPYHHVYEMMKIDKIQGEIQERYQKIMEEKAKRR